MNFKDYKGAILSNGHGNHWAYDVYRTAYVLYNISHELCICHP